MCCPTRRTPTCTSPTILIRKRFNTTEELKAELYAALVEYLENDPLLAESLYLAEYIERSRRARLCVPRQP